MQPDKSLLLIIKMTTDGIFDCFPQFFQGLSLRKNRDSKTPGQETTFRAFFH